MFKCHCDGITVDTAHEQTKQASHSQELFESLAVDGGHLKQSENDHVQHHGVFPAEPISCKTEECSTHGSEKECERDGSSDVSVGLLVISC